MRIRASRSRRIRSIVLHALACFGIATSGLLSSIAMPATLAILLLLIRELGKRQDGELRHCASRHRWQWCQGDQVESLSFRSTPYRSTRLLILSFSRSDQRRLDLNIAADAVSGDDFSYLVLKQAQLLRQQRDHDKR